jgi:hypothetical protein
MFNVLEVFLKKKTSFFHHHGAPPTLEKKDDNGNSRTNSGVDTDNVVDLDMETDIEAVHYHISTDIHTPEAFKMFVDWLYNTKPSTPETQEECRFLLQTYVLAVQYDAAPLQNDIIDCLRKYHVKATVDLNHLIWLTDHTKDNTGLPMTAYLVQQIAYEIADQGVEKYEKHNKYLPNYMREGDCFVRYELVKAIAHLATSAERKAGDPATSEATKWYITELDKAE